ncbi:hypothetical protein LWC34_20235 [Kibdelosporangium philippinense]|uniref:Uncharacterized protein n=1 Tax=Kibdelosporangium philippinense TaxID=211113 RepID=A0ABS8ZB87_9PSEU|nr:hypothetical protein [Kibdelosporangium philippinense]MCE7005138.1 hypothetical protein [Kibdelosporangium philippinense]
MTAIPLADTDGDPAWAPLRITAPSAEYPSGHACFTAAVTPSVLGNHA